MSRAKRIRDRRNRTVACAVAASLVPIVWATGLDAFTGVNPGSIFVVGVMIAVGAAMIVHAVLFDDPHPTCPRCGAHLVINEGDYFGLGTNAAEFDKGVCPKCGKPI